MLTTVLFVCVCALIFSSSKQKNPQDLLSPFQKGKILEQEHLWSCYTNKTFPQMLYLNSHLEGTALNVSKRVNSFRNEAGFLWLDNHHMAVIFCPRFTIKKDWHWLVCFGLTDSVEIISLFVKENNTPSIFLAENTAPCSPGEFFKALRPLPSKK